MRLRFVSSLLVALALIPVTALASDDMDVSQTSAGSAIATEDKGVLSVDAARLRFLAAMNETGEEVTVAFTGDTLTHLRVNAAARTPGGRYDFSQLFTDVRHVISQADLSICHLEVPLSPTSRNLSAYPIFNGPREVADGLAYAGFDGCSTASNHSYDRGVDGVIGTLDVLDEAGLVHAGMAPSALQADAPVLYRTGDLTLGHVSGTYWLNGFRMPEDKSWLVQLLDADELIRSARTAKEAGADLVVVSMHCCTEYVDHPTPQQLELSHRLIKSPFVDLVVTHHSHWVGPVEEVDGEFILHGLGNFLSGQTHTARTADGVIALVKATQHSGEWRFTSVGAVPTYVERGTFRVRVAEPGSPSFERTMGTFNAMGETINDLPAEGLTAVQMSLIE